MYSRSMKGSLMATISTFLEVKAARVTRRPMRPNLKSEQCCFLVWPLDGGIRPCHWMISVKWSEAPDDYEGGVIAHENVKLGFWLSLKPKRSLHHYCYSFFPCERHSSAGDLKPPTKEGQGSGGGAGGGVCCSRTPLWGLKSKWTSNVVILVTAACCLIKQLSYFLTTGPKSWHKYTLFSLTGGWRKRGREIKNRSMKLIETLTSHYVC